eukprot:Skav208026  [mRNA]  locus=scaffold2714:439646:442045:- [translate_table: standard]
MIVTQETRDGDFLWNRVVQLAALAEGYHLDMEIWQRERRASLRLAAYFRGSHGSRTGSFNELVVDILIKVLQAIEEKGEALANHLAGAEGAWRWCPRGRMGRPGRPLVVT